MLRFFSPKGWMPEAGMKSFQVWRMCVCAAGQWSSADRNVAELSPLAPW